MFECYGDGAVLRLSEDGYVSYEGEVEVGLLRDCGAVEVRDFEDGRLYVHRENACGNGVFTGQMPAVYSDLNQVFVTAIFGSIFLILAELTGGNLRPYAQL